MALGPPQIAVSDPGTKEDGTFDSTKDGLKLYLTRYFPAKAATDAPRAHIIFVHGFIEHRGRYVNILPLFAQSNIGVTAFDQRGYGETWTKHPTPKKAHGDTTWKQQFQDLEDLVRIERKRLDEKYGQKSQVPIYLMGHSMGGGISFAFMTRPDDAAAPTKEARDMVAGVILSSPWIRLTNPPPGVLFWVAPRLLRLYSNMPWFAEVNVKDCSHDEEVQKWTTEDPLVDGHVYLRAIVDPLLGGVQLVEREHERWPADKPLICLHGEADKVTSCEASRELLDRVQAKDKEHKGWPDMYHEIWHEKGDIKVQFVQYIIDWVKARAPGQAHM